MHAARYIPLFFIVVFGALLPAPGHAQIPGLPVIDFQRYFPHITAISEEKRDREFPQGVQYKFLTVRDEQENVIVLAMTRREGPTRIVRLFLAKGPIENSETTLKDTVAKFSQRIGMRFEFIDLRDVRTLAEFQARTTALGWGFEVLPK